MSNQNRSTPGSPIDLTGEQNEEPYISPYWPEGEEYELESYLTYGSVFAHTHPTDQSASVMDTNIPWDDYFNDEVVTSQAKPQVEPEAVDSGPSLDSRQLAPMEVNQDPEADTSGSSLSEVDEAQLANLQQEVEQSQDVEMRDNDSEIENENPSEGASSASSSDNDGRIISDADPSHRPDAPNAYEANYDQHQRYIAALHSEWYEEGGDEGQEIHIPDGYLYVCIPRKKGNHEDLYLYGHPGHYRFKSVYEFYPHLAFLIARTNGENDVECECKGCAKWPGAYRKGT